MIIEIRSYSMMFILLVSTLGLNRTELAKSDAFTIIFYGISVSLIVIGIGATYIKFQDNKIDKLKDEVKKQKKD